MRTFSKTVKWGKVAEIWKDRTMPLSATWAGFSEVMSCWLKRIRPLVGIKNLVSKLKKVVFPAPLGPIKAWIEPRCIFKSTALTATNPLNSLTNWWVSRMTSSTIFSACSRQNSATGYLRGYESVNYLWLTPVHSL